MGCAAGKARSVLEMNNSGCHASPHLGDTLLSIPARPTRKASFQKINGMTQMCVVDWT
jgi:hypothetical protein